MHDPAPPFQFDDEFTITLSDWYHRQMPDLIKEYESRQNEASNDGREPLPNSALLNDSTNLKIKVVPNKTYLVHFIGVSNWLGHVFMFEDHDFTIVEVDGLYTEPYMVGDKHIRLSPGQRTSVLFKTKNDTSKNYAIWDMMSKKMAFSLEDRLPPLNYNPNVTGWLVYNESKSLPPPPVVSELNFVDDVDLVPLDHEPLLEPVDHQIIMNMAPANIDGVARFVVNNKTYFPANVPTLYTALTTGQQHPIDPRIYGDVNPFILNYGDVVEIVINNYQNNHHPWHLHGHQYQVLQRTAPHGGSFSGYLENVSATPIRRDTIIVLNEGHAVLRFRATNPGIFALFLF